MQQRIDRIDRRRRKIIDWTKWPDVTKQQQYADGAYDLEVTCRPEVEDDGLIAWGLAVTDGSGEPRAKIDVLHGAAADLSEWSAYVRVVLRD